MVSPLQKRIGDITFKYKVFSSFQKDDILPIQFLKKCMISPNDFQFVISPTST